MKFLVDESCDFVVVRALRQEGYDVLSVCEMAPSMADMDVIQCYLQLYIFCDITMHNLI